MASYHLSAQPVKRSEGRSVVAMAAYRAGERLKDERHTTVADYSKRRGVVHAEIVAPEGCASWLLDRETLWNRVEAMEVRRDAQLAREINMALPHELSDEERLALVRAFVREQFVGLGMVADIAIHAPVVEKGDDPRNHHAHVLLTLRQAGAGGLRRVKTREWNSDAMLIAWRSAWAAHQNRALESGGHRDRVDHRSFTARRQDAASQGNAREAVLLSRVPEIHVGPKARKAWKERPPKSVARKAGPPRKREPKFPVERREVRYPEFDRGSRAQWTMQRLARNARTYAVVAAKAEKQMARLRQRQVYYAKAVQTPKAEAAQQRAASRAHAQKRLAEIAYWLSELDLLFFALLRLRESQLVRRTVWANRLGSRTRGITRSRVWMPE
ncbi:MobQ family relaxase [Tardiphaga sp. P9-11]|uniref:MobQ family relaxase n=1 Tax=Tardiphaga sp. P9-11 TaxID=2024614 RepID=UPI0011F25C4E|nr:MobQ family relaxase [Tardiphaga sp. P9-11]KAA0070460.1 hypothetical protein CIW50_26790 [Tardiphaga sp. P9-11]